MTDKDRFTPKITPLLNNDKNDRLEITGVILEAEKE